MRRLLCWLEIHEWHGVWIQCRDRELVGRLCLHCGRLNRSDS